MKELLNWFEAGAPWLYFIQAIGILLFAMLFERLIEAFSPYWFPAKRKKRWQKLLSSHYENWEISSATEDILAKEQHRLTAGTKIISGMVQVLVMLGLLGTVSGLMAAYQAEAIAMGSGIDKALITTQFALILAIPGALCHKLWDRRSDLLYDRGMQLVNDFTRKENR